MNNIIKIDKRLEEKKQKERMEAYQNRVETLRKTVECSSCHLKCAMCGYHLHDTGPSSRDRDPLAEFTLCNECRHEFEDYLYMDEGGRRDDIPWHNNEWMELWSAWVKFQRAIKRFRDSPEFLLLNDS